MLIVCRPQQTFVKLRPTKLLTTNVATPSCGRLLPQYVSAPVIPEQPCVSTTAGTRSSPSGSLKMPKIVAGVPSSGGGMKGGVNKPPGKVRLWK